MPNELEGLPSHHLEVVGFGVLTLVASFLTYALCWHFLDYSGKGPTQGETRTIVAAYALSIIGACSTMLQGLIVHLLAAELSVLEALFWSSLVRFALALPFVLFDLSKYAARAAEESAHLLPKQSQADEATPQIHRYAMLALRGLMGTFGGHLALYWGVQFLYPSEAAALWSTAPFFALLFGYIMLKEVLSTLTVTMICLGFAGVLLVIQPVELVSWLWIGGFDLADLTHTSACFLVLSGGACQGILGPMMRALKWTVFEVVLWTAGAGVLTALALSALTHPAGAAGCWAWLAPLAAAAPAAAAGWVGLLGLAAFFSTYLLNWAWQLEPAGAVDMVNMSFFVGALFVFQLAVLQEVSNPLAILGILVILAAAAGLVYSRLAPKDPA